MILICMSYDPYLPSEMRGGGSGGHLLHGYTNDCPDRDLLFSNVMYRPKHTSRTQTHLNMLPDLVVSQNEGFICEIIL